MTTNKFYALWYHMGLFGARSAYAISEKPETLIKLHEDNIINPKSWYDFEHVITEIKVDPIECYTYNSITKMIEPYNDNHIADNHAFYAVNTLSTTDSNIFGLTFYDDIIIKMTDSDGNIIGNDDYDKYDDFEKGEILIYLSKTVYEKWMYYHELYKKADEDKKSNDEDKFIMDLDVPKFFYTDWTSHDPVEPHIYYEEGIMNA